MKKHCYEVSLCSFTDNVSWDSSWHYAHDIVEAYSAEDALAVFKNNPRNKAFLSLGKLANIHIYLRVDK